MPLLITSASDRNRGKLVSLGNGTSNGYTSQNTYVQTSGDFINYTMTSWYCNIC
jgi:hypothetical protein